MTKSFDLPEMFSVATLHRWAIADEAATVGLLQRLGFTVMDVIEEFLGRHARFRARLRWCNERPCPNDHQVLSLMFLISERLNCELDDERVEQWVELSVAIMAFPDPIPSCVLLDTNEAGIWLECDPFQLHEGRQQAVGRQRGRNSPGSRFAPAAFAYALCERGLSDSLLPAACRR